MASMASMLAGLHGGPDIEVKKEDAAVVVKSTTLLGAPKKAEKPNYKDLCATDEPLIFGHGGKLMRQYLNEAGLDNQLRDYDTRALFKTLFTNGVFQKVFDQARERVYGTRPTWIKTSIRGEPPVTDNHKEYSEETVTRIEAMRYVGTGFLSLYGMEGTPSDLRCGDARLGKALIAVKKHPALKYVSRGLLGLADLCAQVSPTKVKKRRTADRPRTAAQAALDKQDEEHDQFINDLEKAVFEGDISWFKKSYDSVIDEDEFLVKTDCGCPRCPGCGRIHHWDEGSDVDMD